MSVTNIGYTLRNLTEKSMKDIYDNATRIQTDITVTIIIDVHWLTAKEWITSIERIVLPKNKDSLIQFCKQIRKDLRKTNLRITDEVTMVCVSTKLSKDIYPIGNKITKAKKPVTSFVCDRYTKNLYFALRIVE